MTGGGRAGGGVPHGAALEAFAEAVIGDDADALAAARESVRETLGEAALVDAAAVAAVFNALDRVADGTAIPLEEHKAAETAHFRATLGIDAWSASRED